VFEVVNARFLILPILTYKVQEERKNHIIYPDLIHLMQVRKISDLKSMLIGFYSKTPMFGHGSLNLFIISGGDGLSSLVRFFYEMEGSDNDRDHFPKDRLFHGPFAKWVLAERGVGTVNGIRDLGPRRRHSQVSGGSRTLFDCAAGLQVTYRA
jgi:hypothetical protein